MGLLGNMRLLPHPVIPAWSPNWLPSAFEWEPPPSVSTVTSQLRNKESSMLKNALIIATSLLVSTAAFAEVKADCTAQMNGEARCEFMNTGKKKDSACVVIEVVRAYDAKLYSRPSFGGKGAALTSEKICSGLVEPQDIRERSPSNSWSVRGTPMSPMSFCESDNPWEKASTNCIMATKSVPI